MSYNIRIIDLYKSDPLLKFLTKRLNIDPIIIISRIFMIQLVLIFINCYISYIFYSGEQIIGVFDQEYNLFEALVMPLVGVPLLWYGYLWQPKVIDYVFSSFMQNNLIIDNEIKKFRNFIIGMENMINSYYTIIVALSLSIIFLYIFIFKVDPIQAVVTEDKIPYWFYFDKRYYYLFHIPVAFIFSIYPLLMLFTKFILIFIYLNKFLLEFKLRIRPLHPDECGGLGNLGHMITVYGIFIVVLGIAMTILSKLGRTYFTIDVIFGYILYIILILILICTILNAHYSMKRFRNHFLFEKLSKSFDLILANAEENSLDFDKLMNNLMSLAELKKQSDTLKRSYPLWPIPMRSFQISLLIANLPLLIGLLDKVLSRLSG